MEASKGAGSSPSLVLSCGPCHRGRERRGRLRLRTIHDPSDRHRSELGAVREQHILRLVFEDPSVGCGETENCPSNAVIGTVWTDSVPFTYGPAEFNLTVRNMTISPSFEILSSIPQIPVFLVPGQGVIFFHIAIHLPWELLLVLASGEIWVSK